MRKLTKEGLQQTDKRVSLMNEILAAMDTVKCYAWEKSFQSRVQSIRYDELLWFRKAQLLSAVHKPTLSNINLDIPVGSLVAIVGRTGEGKTSLISAMLGELPVLEDASVAIRGTVAYVPQLSWIFNATMSYSFVIFLIILITILAFDLLCPSVESDAYPFAPCTLLTFNIHCLSYVKMYYLGLNLKQKILEGY
ncbi:hypothetical protein LWI29_028056 [Acer saccharum]|uniref:ABC transmembrane type-1 domain-containing protein n=1 Tax=Acer saccharum TaxID=4024 RepID=A0AA39VI89_ACESA|nr:hypothetical protein LWI29_028056 [Acer saccharum]